LTSVLACRRARLKPELRPGARENGRVQGPAPAVGEGGGFGIQLGPLLGAASRVPLFPSSAKMSPALQRCRAALHRDKPLLAKRCPEEQRQRAQLPIMLANHNDFVRCKPGGEPLQRYQEKNPLRRDRRASSASQGGPRTRKALLDVPGCRGGPEARASDGRAEKTVCPPALHAPPSVR